MNTENKKSPAAEREEKILEFWQKEKIFEKSLTKDAPKPARPDAAGRSGGGNYVFYDGPPFATGLPHYGHILGSTAKDVIGRYQTMRGYHVPRRWGWDCHGLPIENIVEKDLGVSGHVEIEKLGVEKFVEHARSKVLTYVHEWKKTVDRIGRWVDFDGGYKTMDNTFIESVWWALGQMQEKGLLYEGVRVLAYCPRCETPIAKSEIAMDNSYKDITDISVYVKFELADEKGTYLLAWTTTPWTLPGNTAIAINTDIEYAKVKVGDDTLILSESSIAKVLNDKEYSVIGKMSGKDLLGLRYEPIFPYFKDAEIANKENIWKIWHADFVTTDQGTGIAHEAPAFGEDDMNLAKPNNIPWIIHVTPEGKFTDDVKDFAGLAVKPKGEEKDANQKTDIEIIKYLAKTGALFAKEKIVHSYPHCYRCETPLFYYALPSWFVNIQKVKSDMLEKAKTMAWIPEHLKDGRFKNTMESAPDWNISRNRYWASPLPFWKSESGKLMTVSSIEDLKKKTKKSGNRYFIMRHGEAGNNLSKMWNDNDHHHALLTDKGKEQVAESIAKFDHPIDVVISSPFERAKQTTEIVCEKLGFPVGDVVYDARITEMEPGTEFEGQELGTVKEYYDREYVYSPEKQLKGGESFVDVAKRMGDFIYDLESKFSGKNIFIVGHHASSRALEFLASGFTFAELKKKNDAYPDFLNAQIRELPFVPLPHNANYELDLHRPYIDAITLVDLPAQADESGEEYHRIAEVIDCWFESGSMPFAQDHYPFERPNWHTENFPAGFVAEYIAQTRTWFYYTHTISSILFGAAPFEHVVTTGTLLAEDGQKMSKSKNNFPDPWILFDKYGVDPLRLYLMSSPLMKGEDTNFMEKSVQDIASKIIGRLGNVLAFYELYRTADSKQGTADSTNVLDVWIVSRLNQLITEVTKGMEAYDMAEATRPLDLFVDDLSTWYLRRSRERIKDGDAEAKQTLYFVLKTLARVMAPFTPFVAEDVWQQLKSDGEEESIHLALWPKAGTVDTEALEPMQLARDFCAVGNALRKKSGIPVRQPLATLFITEDISDVYKEIIKDELNVKGVEKGPVILFDERITPELKREGDYRELVRAVQDARKAAGLTPSDTIVLTLPETARETVAGFETDMKKTVLAKDILFGGEIKVEKQ